MKIDVERLSAEDLSEVAERSRQRLEEVTEAQRTVPGVERALEEAVIDRDDANGRIHAHRAELERLREIIKPKRRRKQAVPEVPKDDYGAPIPPAAKPPRRRRKAVVPFDQPKNASSV